MIDYISANLWQMWAIVAVGCLVVELFTGGFFILCFSIGAVFAAIASLFGGFSLQLCLFAVFSALSIFLVRPFALRCLHRGETPRLSNADALIGRVGIVSQEICAGGFGRVAIDGDDWKAQADGGEAVPCGTRVIVTGRDSIIIRVTKLE